MVRRSVLLCAIIVGMHTAHGQNASDGTTSASSSKFNHYLGLQANQLVRQVFNFSNNSPLINTPYLLTYSFNSASGFGGNFGLGYNFDESTDGDGITARTITNSDFYFRVGAEMKRQFGKRFLLAYGVDGIIQREITKTEVQDNFSGQFTTTNKDIGWGLGPRLGISYAVTENVLVGTEATYYLKFIDQTFKVEPGSTENDSVTRFQFAAPTAIFLMLKF